MVFLRLKQVFIMPMLLFVFFSGVESLLPPKPNIPRVKVVYGDPEGKGFFLPQDGAKKIGNMYGVKPELIVSVINSGATNISADTNVNLYVLDNCKVNFTLEKPIARIPIGKELTPKAGINMTAFSDVTLGANAKTTCEPVCAVFTVDFKDAKNVLHQKSVLRRWVLIGGACIPPKNGNVKVAVTPGVAPTIQQGADNEHFLDTATLLRTIKLTLENVPSGLLEQRNDSKGQAMPYGAIAFLRKIPEKGQSMMSKCPKSQLVGPADLQIQDVVLKNWGVDKIQNNEASVQLAGKVMLTGKNSKVCPFSVCGKLQLVIMFDYNHELEAYKEFDQNKCDNIAVVNVTIDCKPIVAKLKTVSHAEVIPDVTKKGLSSYTVSCVGMNPPQISVFDATERSWRKACLQSMDKAALKGMARLRVAAKNLQPVLSTAIGDKMCSAVLSSGRKSGGSPADKAITTTCRDSLNKTWEKYYDEDMSLIKKDPAAYKTDMMALAKDCEGMEVVGSWLKAVMKMFNGTGFNESFLHKAEIGEDNECPSDDYRKRDDNNTPQSMIRVKLFNELFKDDKKPKPTMCEKNPFEKNKLLCAYQLVAQTLSGPKQAMLNQDMKEHAKNQSARMDADVYTELLKKLKFNGTEAMKKMGEKYAQCHKSENIEPLDVPPTFIRVLNGKILMARFNPFDAAEEYCWHPVGTVRCTNCEKRVFGTEEHKSKYQCYNS